MPKKQPLRMCVACREMKEKQDLLRVVKTKEGKVFVGWYDESMENTVDYGAQITDDMAYWAKWDE